MSEIIKKQIEVYRPNFLKHGDSPKSAFWNNAETQYLRFAKLIENLPLSNNRSLSIHDVGAGMCDLHKFLIEQDIDHVYSGTEIVQEMIDAASKKYPEVQLMNRDLLKVADEETYDFVVLSGTFNFPGLVSSHEWEKFCKETIKKMFSLSKKGIAFNFLTTESTFTDPLLFYFSPAEIFSFCQRHLSRFVLLDHSYPLYEFTVTVMKKSYQQAQYSEEVFDKYFKN